MKDSLGHDVEYLPKKKYINKRSVVCYDAWQMQCCGRPFRVGYKVQWLVEKCHETVPFKIPTDPMNYYFNSHTSEYKKLYVLEGRITAITAVFESREQIAKNGRECNEDNGVELCVESSDEAIALDRVYRGGFPLYLTSGKVKRKLYDLDFEGYLVYFDKITIRKAIKQEVTFK